MEKALKMRNLLQEFLKKHDDVRYPTILGLREHIFTGRYVRRLRTMLLCFHCLFVHKAHHAYLLAAVFLLWHGLCLTKKQVS